MSEVEDIHGLRDLKVPLLDSVLYEPLPPSDTSCKVTVIRTGEISMPLGMMLRMDTKDKIRIPVFTFLIEHPDGRNVVFDLGLKADLTTYPPVVQSALGRNPTVPPKKPLAEIVADLVPLDSIEAVVLSHTHWDHVGDISAFPTKTKLVIGSGVIKSRLPGYPSDPEANVNDADLPINSERVVHELGPDDPWNQIGAFTGIDYFGDGSFYILEAEGHMIGHIAALVRTTTSPATFLILAGDAAHMRAQYSCCKGHSHPPFQAGLYAAKDSFSPKVRAKGGLLALHDDLDIAYKTMSKMGRMEKEDGVMVFLAHDIEWEKVLDKDGDWEYKDVTDWHAKGIKEAVEESRVHMPTQ
ncbi:hypothetical protein IAT38_000396 [Cryptococcus sp. DSM 104549]